MNTSIQIKEKTKSQLLKLMAKLQAKADKKLSYEDVIQYLIDKENNRVKKRREFSQKYLGVLRGTNAKRDLRESRIFER